MTPKVCIPYRPQGEPHESIAAFAMERWASWGFIVFPADSGAERFEMGTSRNLAAIDAGEWDSIMFCDADVVVGSRATALEALRLASEKDTYVTPHSDFHYLTDEGAVRFVQSGEPDRADIYHGTRTWLCCFAIGRGIWEEIGGFDVAYGSHYGEDVSFFHQVTELREPIYLKGDAYHLGVPHREKTFGRI